MFIGMMVFVGGVGIGIVGDVSIRDGSFFGNGSKLELEKVMDLLYSYSYETASFKNLMRECRIASEACVNWRNFVRDIYGEYFIRHPLRIGGPGHVVEIDESAFCVAKAQCWPSSEDSVGFWRARYRDSGWISSCHRQERCRYSVASLAGVCAASNNSRFGLMGRLSHSQQLRLPASNSKPQASFH